MLAISVFDQPPLVALVADLLFGWRVQPHTARVLHRFSGLAVAVVCKALLRAAKVACVLLAFLEPELPLPVRSDELADLEDGV